jgi:hypothetical protein
MASQLMGPQVVLSSIELVSQLVNEISGIPS